MSSRRKTKSSEQQLKTVKRLKRFVTTMEVIFGLLIVMMAVILFVPSVKTQVVKAMANTAIGQKIITWWGNNSYNESVRDLNFDDNSIKTNKLKYNYSEEYTNFVLFGVDSREGVVDNYKKAVNKVLYNKKYDEQAGKRQLLQLFNRSGFTNAYLKKNTGKDIFLF